MNTNQFTETYKKLAVEKLLYIIDNQKNYKPLAVETAISELKTRQLSEEQIATAHQRNREACGEKAQSNKISRQRVEALKHTIDTFPKSLNYFRHQYQKRRTAVTKEIESFVSRRPLLSTLCILVFEFGFGTALLFQTINGPIIAPPPLAFLVFPGLPLLHVVIFLVNRKSPKNDRRILAKYTLNGHIIFWSTIIIYILLF